MSVCPLVSGCAGPLRKLNPILTQDYHSDNASIYATQRCEMSTDRNHELTYTYILTFKQTVIHVIYGRLEHVIYFHFFRSSSSY